MQARPTEYEGTRYRSKSEAIFARAMHVSSKIDGFTYEPGYLTAGRWTPDFLVMTHQEVFWVLEYKPGEVTEVYKDELLARFETVCSSDFFGDDHQRFGVLFSGSPYNTSDENPYRLNVAGTCPDCGDYQWLDWSSLPSDLVLDPVRDIISRLADARRFRFDLRSSGRRSPRGSKR